jgi:hypothetical protein
MGCLSSAAAPDADDTTAKTKKTPSRLHWIVLFTILEIPRKSSGYEKTEGKEKTP